MRNRGEGGLAFFHVCLLISLSLKFCFDFVATVGKLES